MVKDTHFNLNSTGRTLGYRFKVCFCTGNKHLRIFGLEPPGVFKIGPATVLDALCIAGKRTSLLFFLMSSLKFH